MKLLVTIFSLSLSINAMALTIKSFTVSSSGPDNYVTKVEIKDGKVFARITECWKTPVKDIPVTLTVAEQKDAALILKNQALLTSDQTPRELEFGDYANPRLTVDGLGFSDPNPAKETSVEIVNPVVFIQGLNSRIINSIADKSDEICDGLKRHEEKPKAEPKHEGMRISS
jgi:hypothetical protein